MYYSYVEIEYVATSFSPARTDLALNSLTARSVLAGMKLVLFGRYVLNIYVGIVKYFLRKTRNSVRQNLLTNTMDKLVNIVQY